MKKKNMEIIAQLINIYKDYPKIFDYVGSMIIEIVRFLIILILWNLLIPKFFGIKMTSLELLGFYWLINLILYDTRKFW